MGVAVFVAGMCSIAYLRLYLSYMVYMEGFTSIDLAFNFDFL